MNLSFISNHMVCNKMTLHWHRFFCYILVLGRHRGSNNCAHAIGGQLPRLSLFANAFDNLSRMYTERLRFVFTSPVVMPIFSATGLVGFINALYDLFLRMFFVSICTINAFVISIWYFFILSLNTSNFHVFKRDMNT